MFGAPNHVGKTMILWWVWSCLMNKMSILSVNSWSMPVLNTKCEEHACATHSVQQACSCLISSMTMLVWWHLVFLSSSLELFICWNSLSHLVRPCIFSVHLNVLKCIIECSNAMIMFNIRLCCDYRYLSINLDKT